MSDWVRVSKCPKCGGDLVLSEYYTYSIDYCITKKGTISKRHTRSDGGPIDCMTACCDKCESFWDATQVFVEKDGHVLLRT